jgi:hypothetical protein
MTSGFYYRAQRTRLQEIVQPVGADGGRAFEVADLGYKREKRRYEEPARRKARFGLR